MDVTHTHHSPCTEQKKITKAPHEWTRRNLWATASRGQQQRAGTPPPHPRCSRLVRAQLVLVVAWMNAGHGSSSQPSFAAAGAACSGRVPVAAAFIIAGQPRTLTEPLAQRGLVSAIQSFGADAFTFAYLTDDDGGSSKGHAAVVHTNITHVQEAIAALRPKAVYYGPLTRVMSRPPEACHMSASLLAPYAGPDSKPTWRVWWETWEKLRRAFDLVTEYERTHRLSFDWVVRLRPDLWFFGERAHISSEQVIS